MSTLHRASVLTCHLDPLLDVVRIYPKAEQTFRTIVRAANLGKGIRAPEFQFKKERILILHYLLMNINGMDRDQIKSLADAVLIHRETRATLDLLKSFVKGDEGSSGSRRIPSWGNIAKPTREETLWRGARDFASSVPDSEFLTQLKTGVLDECLREATAEAEETAYVCLTAVVESLVSGIGQQILSMQKGECDKQIQREVGSAEERELGILRSDFVHQIEDLTRQRSRSYVHHILVVEDSLMQCSRTSIHVDNFIPKKERYYSPGMFDYPVKTVGVS